MMTTTVTFWKLPDAIKQHIYEYDGTYQEKKKQLVSEDIWRASWMRRYATSTPRERLVWDYLFEMWGVRDLREFHHNPWEFRIWSSEYFRDWRCNRGGFDDDMLDAYYEWHKTHVFPDNTTIANYHNLVDDHVLYYPYPDSIEPIRGTDMIVWNHQERLCCGVIVESDRQRADEYEVDMRSLDKRHGREVGYIKLYEDEDRSLWMWG